MGVLSPWITISVTLVCQDRTLTQSVPCVLQHMASTLLCLLRDENRLRLRIQAQLRRREDVALRHRHLGAVEAVEDELAEEGEPRLPSGVDVALRFVRDQENVVAATLAGYVDILPDLYAALSAQDKEATIAPRT